MLLTQTLFVETLSKDLISYFKNTHLIQVNLKTMEYLFTYFAQYTQSCYLHYVGRNWKSAHNSSLLIKSRPISNLRNTIFSCENLFTFFTSHSQHTEVVNWCKTSHSKKGLAKIPWCGLARCKCWATQKSKFWTCLNFSFVCMFLVTCYHSIARPPPHVLNHMLLVLYSWCTFLVTFH